MISKYFFQVESATNLIGKIAWAIWDAQYSKRASGTQAAQDKSFVNKI